MVRRFARTVGFLAAAVPVLGLLATYIVSCQKHGTPFSSDGWVYLPVTVSCMPTIFLLAPVFMLMPHISTDGIAMHIVLPIEVAIVSVLNYYIVFYAVVLIAAIIRRVRGRKQDETGTS